MNNLMTKANLLKGAAALGAVALLTGGIMAANAATGTVKTNAHFGFGRFRLANLSAAQKTALEARLQAWQAHRTAVQTALKNNDYAAWVAAVGTSSPLVAKITTANFAQYVQAFNLEQQADALRQQAAGILKNLGVGFGGRIKAMAGSAATAQ